MTSSKSQLAARKILHKVKSGMGIENLMKDMSCIWMQDKDVLLETIGDVGLAIGNWKQSDEFRNSIEELWFSILNHHGKSGGMEKAMVLFLDNSDLGEQTLASLAVAKGTSWAKRDKFVAQTYPLVMDWMEKNRNPAFIRKTLDYITDQVVRVACREDRFAEQELSRMLKHYTPSDIVRISPGREVGAWAHCWAHQCVHGERKNSCGARVLDMLVSWGADVDQPGINGSSALEDHVEKYKYNGDNHYIVECLTRAGAQWRHIYDRGTEEQRQDLMKSSTVRRELLSELTRGGPASSSAPAVDPGRGKPKAKM